MMNMIKRIFKKLFFNNISETEYLISNGLVLGKNLRNHSEYAIDSLFPWLITVGDNVCISQNVKILAHDTSTEYVNGHTKIGAVSIGNNVYIGYGTTVLCGTNIGDNSIIGAGSVVTSSVPENCVYAGNPAKFICTLQDYKKKHSTNLISKKVYDGPCGKWKDISSEKKSAMRHDLNGTFGYMK